METEDDNNEDDDSGTALTLVAVAGGAVLLWLVLGRGGGRGAGRGGGQSGVGSGDGASAGRDEQKPSGRPPVSIYLSGDERIEVDGIVTDLKTALALAKASGKACLAHDGAIRHGFVVEFRDALKKAGVIIGTTKNVYNDKRERIARSGDHDCLNSPTFSRYSDAYSAQYPDEDIGIIHRPVNDIILQLQLQHALSK